MAFSNGSVRVAITFGTKATEDRMGPYERALRKVGLEPVRNPGSLDSLHGLLLSGGSDIDPKHYNQPRSDYSENFDDQRDTLELQLVREARAADIPVFGICRGLQLLNVACGGTLQQHLPNTPVHRQRPKGAESGRHPAAHDVQVKHGTHLARIIGAGLHPVNSRHHQAVDALGENLIVSAQSEDGVVEGLEHQLLTFAIAVQWHPEDRIFANAADLKLFEAFAEAVAKSPAAHRAAPLPSS